MNDRRRDVLLILILAALPILAYAPAWRGGLLLAPGDGTALHLPLRAEAWRALDRGEIPSWNTASFSGTPLLAAYRPGTFHPLMAALTPLAPFAAFQILVLLSLALTAPIGFVYARRLGAEPVGALVSGLGFALGPYLVTHLGDTATVVAAPALPLALLAVEIHLARARATSATFVAFAAAALIGLYLLARGGWPIAVLGLLALLAGYAYTGGPAPLGYRGLGDPLVFLFFGVFAVWGTHRVQTLGPSDLALAASVPIGLLATALIAVNNLRDIDTDRGAGKRTLAVRLGPSGARWYYALLLAGGYAALPALWWLGAPAAAALLPLSTVPLAWRLWRRARTQEGAALNQILAGTARLELYFAAPCSGRVLHTLNIRLFPEQLTYIANHAEDEVVFADRSLLPLIVPLVPTFETVKHLVVMDERSVHALRRNHAWIEVQHVSVADQLLRATLVQNSP